MQKSYGVKLYFPGNSENILSLMYDRSLRGLEVYTCTAGFDSAQLAVVYVLCVTYRYVGQAVKQ